MSDPNTNYTVGRKDLRNIRNTTLNLFNDGWEQPTSEEVRNLIILLGEKIGEEKLTGSQVAALVGLKDSRNVRKWTAPEDSNNFIKIPYSAWRLLLAYGEIIELDLVAAV